MTPRTLSLRRRHHAGFSLLELSIVMVIIALLAALIIAASGAAREKGRQTRCVSNLHQIGAALQMYRTDYDGADAVKGTPSTCAELGLPEDDNGRSTAQWLSFVTTYVKSPEVLRCPDSQLQNLAPMGCNYEKFSCEPTDGASPYTMPGDTSARGNQVVILSDSSHNALEETEQPRWATKRVIVYRLDGSLQTRMVPRDMLGDQW